MPPLASDPLRVPAQLQASFPVAASMATLRRLRLAALIAVAAAVVVAGPARAAPVIVVDGAHAKRMEDPFVPSAAEIDLGPEPGPAHVRAPSAPRPRAFASSRGSRAVLRVLARALRAQSITRPDYDRYRRAYRRIRSAWRRLAGARQAEVGYLIRSLERIALGGRLTPSRMPLLFLQLERNTTYWPSKPFPAAGDQISFRGSEIVFQYFPGRGLQFHPLANFKKANLLHGACARSGRGNPVCGARPPGPRAGTPCRPQRLRRLLDELSRLAVKRGPNFTAWEYMFHFNGGSPPWMSAMAQSVAVTALARASRLLGRPDYVTTAQAALGAFEAGSPTGVRTTGPYGGVHYLQYSFAPRLFVFNAFFQSLIGLHDFGRLTGDQRATALFRQGEPEARAEVPSSDTGDWSRYSFRGRASTPLYHELLREVLQGLGRRIGAPYCDYAVRYRGYQTSPPAITFSGPPETVKKRLSRIGFGLTKLSIVEVKVYKGRRLVLRRLATLARGGHAFRWRPRSAGRYVVRLGAKELRTGRFLRGRGGGVIMVKPRAGA